ncbi:thiolase family protein [Streptomyces prunicolor]|uniref:Probable acetyl-CoA acetyltransferase n=1 Tax=Streptomyces prunicolor TaxID=67348 RepID=A0ABU4FBY8_9ACTN|nr:thiolase family protein [Streptomyces prunicolor]MCX5240359.1 thiolase family protein [Streptomyces prunicolor]MDV7218086.1 thiolase family protein [Streptomyces prunicolor]
MPEAVIVSAVRTAIGTAYKGSLSETSAEDLARHVVAEAVERSGLAPESFDDVVLAESMYGGGDLARHAAVSLGMTEVAGQAVNRHCAGSLTAVGIAAGSVRAGMDQAVIAGGAQSSSLAPKTVWRVPGTVDRFEERMAPTFPYTADATDDVTLSTGWNVALEAGLTREQLDAWAYRSHARAVAAIDADVFVDEIASIKVTRRDGSVADFAIDEHPRRSSTLEKLATLKPLHPEIEGFSITAGNAAGVNDAAAALAVVSDELARTRGLTPLATVRAWAATGVAPRRTGMGAVEVIPKVLQRAGLSIDDVALWEINEAFASVPAAACKLLGLDEELVNIFGSGCSLGHPVAASGARMLTTLTHELRRRGGGIGVAAMCAGGGQAGAVVIEVR